MLYAQFFYIAIVSGQAVPLIVWFGAFAMDFRGKNVVDSVGWADLLENNKRNYCALVENKKGSHLEFRSKVALPLEKLAKRRVCNVHICAFSKCEPFLFVESC